MDLEAMPELGESCSETSIQTFSEEAVNINDEQNIQLENRLGSLKVLMENLRTELSKEKELWKKEIEEVSKVSNQSIEPMCTCCCEEDVYSNSSHTCLSEPTLHDMSILDYEQKLSIYQQTLAKAHADKRLHLRRHLAANAYKSRLLELENMCNMELLKVRQNVQCLQPLQAIASEWNYEQHENQLHLDDELTGGQSMMKNDHQINTEPTMALENFGNKVNEIKEISARLSPAHSSMGTRTTTTSSLLPDEDEDALMMRRLQSVGWYWYNDKSNYPCNPLM